MWMRPVDWPDLSRSRLYELLKLHGIQRGPGH